MSGASSARKKQRALSETEKKILKEAFELFDSNNDGYLDYYEFKASSRCLGFHLKKPELLAILETYARSDKNMICYEDFYELPVVGSKMRWDIVKYEKHPQMAELCELLIYSSCIRGMDRFRKQGVDPHVSNIKFRRESFWVEEKMVKRDPMEEIKEAFKLIANDKTNAITFRDLKHAAEKVGADIPDRDLRSMIEEFDTKGEGKLDEEDFISLITGEAF